MELVVVQIVAVFVGFMILIFTKPGHAIVALGALSMLGSIFWPLVLGPAVNAVAGFTIVAASFVSAIIIVGFGFVIIRLEQIRDALTGAPPVPWKIGAKPPPSAAPAPGRAAPAAPAERPPSRGYAPATSGAFRGVAYLVQADGVIVADLGRGETTFADAAAFERAVLQVVHGSGR